MHTSSQSRMSSAERQYLYKNLRRKVERQTSFVFNNPNWTSVQDCDFIVSINHTQVIYLLNPGIQNLKNNFIIIATPAHYGGREDAVLVLPMMKFMPGSLRQICRGLLWHHRDFLSLGPSLY